MSLATHCIPYDEECSLCNPPLTGNPDDRSSSPPPPSDGNAIARITASLSIAVQFGQTDGAHHKAWVIDQMVRALTGDNYAEWVAVARSGEDGPTTFEWDKGVAP